MKIKILRDTVANKKPVFTGDELEIDDMQARLLINLGKAEDVRLLPEEPPPAAETKPEDPEVKKETSKDLDLTSTKKATQNPKKANK